MLHALRPPAPPTPLSPRIRATYRVQLHAGFTFADAAALVPHLARLGVSHLYCSPILQAAPGSTHGYDVVDPTRISDELGGRSGFDQLARALADHDLGLLVDIVPNHMALAGPANAWWWDLLEDGPHSRWARAFDIDWTPAPGSAGPSVLMPVLGDHVGRVLEAGELGLQRRGGAFVLRYGDRELPLSLPSLAPLLAAVAASLDGAGAAPRLAAVAAGMAELPALGDPDERHEARERLRHELRAVTAEDAAVATAVDDALAKLAADPERLDELLAQQSYRLAHWRTASEELDYRRFFDVTDLVGVRVEDPAVFAETHRLVAELVTTGEVAGLRIDHIDGLRDPAGYLDRLQEATPDAVLLVEKILGPDEQLPASWPVAGTTGYDFLRVVGDVFVDPEGAAALDAAFAERVDPTPFADVAYTSRLRVAAVELAAEVERVVDLLATACLARRRHRDHTRRDLRGALQTVLACFEVYRTYVVPWQPAGADDRRWVARAVASARERRPDLDGELLELIEHLLLGEGRTPTELELAARFQQLSGPVMAKGVEDTAFYRYVPLLSRNEVGGHPDRLGGVEELHTHNAWVAEHHPRTMLTLATHDTKRSADVRARLSVLSEVAGPWVEALATWERAGRRHWAGAAPDPLVEQVLYQSLVGVWPIGADRLVPTVLKSVREAKLATSWRDPDEAYEAAVTAFVEGVLADGELVGAVERFLVEHDVVARGRAVALAQTTLLLTSPGVPDLYQGSEVWDLSLVDPDNRRPVDHEVHAHLLDVVEAAGPDAARRRTDEGGPKLWLVQRLLQHRRQHPDRYDGAPYRPLCPEGPAAGHVVAFEREDLVVAVPRLLGRLDGWSGTMLPLPPGRWVDLLSGAGPWEGAAALGDLLDAFPVAVLEPA